MLDDLFEFEDRVPEWLRPAYRGAVFILGMETARLVKSPKVLLTDSGLASYLLGLDAARMERESVLRGGRLESLVAMELRKQIGGSGLRVTLYHLRSHSGEEVDLVLEGPGGDLVGIEVKAAASVSNDDFKGLRALAELAKRQFHRGVVLYTGTESVPFGSGLEARPIQSLWT